MNKMVSVMGLAISVISGVIGSGLAMADEVENVTVTATEFKFIPDTIKVKQDAKLHLVLDNKGALSHNLTFTGLDKSTPTIQGRDQAEITLPPPEPGRYQFICSVPGHANAGMKGTLIVE